MADINRSIPHRRPAMSNTQQLELDSYLAKISTVGPQARAFMNALKVSGPGISSYIGNIEFAGVSCKGAPALVIYDINSQPVSILLMVKNTDDVYEDVMFPGAEFAGCFGRIGTGSGTILVTETYAAGLAIHHATKLSVVVALFAENLAPVVLALRERHADRLIIVCANNADSSPGKSNLHHSVDAASAGGGSLAIPTLRTFDEQLASEGEESVVLSIANAVSPSVIQFPEFQETSGIPVPPLPWPNAVNGTAMMENLLAVLSRFLVMSTEAKIILVLWIIFTHAFNAARVAPILALLSPVRRCGKTTVLQILTSLVSRPYATSNITPAVLFRTVNAWQPTMLLDEADTYLANGDHALTGILNSGHTPESGFVTRIVKGIPVQFRTYCPKFIAAIGSLPETTSDRAITIPARRKRFDEHVEKYPPKSNGLMVALHSQIRRWVGDNLQHIAAAEPYSLHSGNDRTDDNFEILLKIADCLGGSWPDLAKAAALTLVVRHDQTRAGGVELLRDIKIAFQSAEKSRLRTIDLIAGICDDVEKPWATYSKGRPITPRELGDLLRPFGVSSKSFAVGEARPKGYEWDQFEDAFARYCDAGA